MNAIRLFYSRKNIKIRVIIDQINALYNKPKRSRINRAKFWSDLTSSTRIVYLISSKNNAELTRFDDPTYIIAGSDKF